MYIPIIRPRSRRVKRNMPTLSTLLMATTQIKQYNIDSFCPAWNMTGYDNSGSYDEVFLFTLRQVVIPDRCTHLAEHATVGAGNTCEHPPSFISCAAENAPRFRGMVMIATAVQITPQIMREAGPSSDTLSPTCVFRLWYRSEFLPLYVVQRPVEGHKLQRPLR